MVKPNAVQLMPETNNMDQLFFLFDSIGTGSLAFAVRTPAGERLADDQGRPFFRMVPARQCPKCRMRTDAFRCATCKDLTGPSPEVPYSTALRECVKCKVRTAEMRCEKCAAPTLGPEDAYKVVLHASRTDLPRLLPMLAEAKLRIEVVPDAGGIKLVIRR
jgi:hypothetical protein